MSEIDNKPALLEEPLNDFSEKDLSTIKEYMDEGLPSIAAVDSIKMTRILDMYLSGRTYRQISQIMSMKKQIVMYLSYRFNWFQIRQEYLTDLEQSIRARVMEARIINQDFLLQLQQMWQKKIGHNMSRYLATDNPEFANNIDLKEIDKYLKTVEILHKLDLNRAQQNSNGNPAVGLNLGEGVTIVKNSDNSVEITPKSKAIGDALKQFADFRREEESKKK